MAKSTTNGNYAEMLASEVMKARYAHGDEWQDYIADKFEECGIQPTFFKINDGLSDRIADYQYDENWIEAKTFINSAEVTKILKLKETLETKNIRMTIMCEWKPNDKKKSKNVKDLRNAGIIVFEGQSQCDSFIINESVRLNPNKTIQMAEPKAIPFERIIPHPNNRDLNVKNVPIIKASITKNGFFTQLNVVPLGIEDKKKRNIPIDEEWYMIFEGHTRYYSLKELIEKGYTVPKIACIVVPWITSDNIDLLHKILITTNTTYQSWKLKNYITSHLGNLTTLHDMDGIFSYGKILQSMKNAKKQKWGEANPIYLFSHIDSLSFDDMKKVKNGEYKISETHYNEQIKPILDLMESITKDDRIYNGTIMRDILVDIRVMYNTDNNIKNLFTTKFLPWLELKFVNDYKADRFPNTKETGQLYWKTLKEEFFGLIKLGMV